MSGPRGTDKRRSTQAYWDARLTRMGLSPERGRHDWLVYGHLVSALDYDGVKTYTTAADIEENQEWPISI
jgi:hypothetical protein